MKILLKNSKYIQFILSFFSYSAIALGLLTALLFLYPFQTTHICSVSILDSDKIKANQPMYYVIHYNKKIRSNETISRRMKIGDTGHFQYKEISLDLPYGEHRIIMEVTAPDEKKNVNANLGITLIYRIFWWRIVPISAISNEFTIHGAKYEP
jgi:hypothetical protein